MWSGTSSSRGTSAGRSRVAIGLAAGLVALIAGWVTAATAHARLAPGLCKSTTARGEIPSSFAVNACFDGTRLKIYNNLNVAMGVSTTGSAGSPKRTTSNYDLAALATRGLSSDRSILLPGDELNYPIGSGPASAKLRTTGRGGFFMIASAFDNFIPGKTTGIVRAFTAMVREVETVYRQYADCMTSPSRVHRAGCRALLVRNIAFAGSRFVTNGALSAAKKNLGKILGVLGSTYEFARWADSQPGHLKALIYSGTIRLTGSNPGQGSQQAPEPSTSPPDAGQGDAGTGAPSGSLPGGVPAGSVPETAGGVTHTWTNYTNAGGAQGPSIQTGQTVGIACKLQGFKVANGNTWWYKIASSPWNGVYYASADAFYNNGQTSGSLAGTPFVDPSVPDCAGSPPPPPPTLAETTGGATNTWTNYTNAGGTQGATIPTHTTVQIACKLTGFKVSDGNTWWYRIASSPWNGVYYASADAFYNHGATSGSLVGTPFVDNNVPNC